MPMYNLLEYSGNYPMTSGSLWNYYRNEVNNDVIENDNANNKINNDKTVTNLFLKYKAKIIGRTPDDNNTLDNVVPLKYLSNFWSYSFCH